MFGLPLGALLCGVVALSSRQAAGKLAWGVGGLYGVWGAWEIVMVLWRTTGPGLWLTTLGELTRIGAGLATRDG